MGSKSNSLVRYAYIIVYDKINSIFLYMLSKFRFVDGIERYKITDKAKIPKEKMYLIMNVAVGGNYPGSPDGSTPFPTHMIIDYVTVHRWQ